MASLATIAAAAVGTAAAAGYLDAKFHIRKDIRTLRATARIQKQVIEAAKSKRQSLWYKFEAQAQNLPPSTQCIWSREGNYTFQQTYDETNKYANFLQSHGVTSNTLVAMYMTNSPEFVFSMLGIWALGCGVPLINYHLAGEPLVHSLRVTKAKFLIVDEDSECRARIEDVREKIEKEMGITIIILDGKTKQEIDRSSSARLDDSVRDSMKPTFPVGLLYTSGSTGLPKAVAFSAFRANVLGESHLMSMGLKGGPDGSRLYDCMPMYHGTGALSAMSCLLGGATLCIGKRFSTRGFWEDVRDSDADAFIYVGETARYLLSAPESPLDKQHKVKVAWGNGMRPDVWARFQERFGIETICEFFNSSEGTFGLNNPCRGPFFQNAVGHHGALIRWRFRDFHVPVEVDYVTGDLVRDPKTGLAIRKPYEEGGEILVKLESEAMWPGYFGNREATQKKFVRNILHKDDLYYRTGDALRRLPDGRWYFMDRLGDTYRWKSENVSTAEVSDALGRCPGIEEAIVYGVKVPRHEGRAGCAALMLDTSVSASPEFFSNLLAFSKNNLPQYAIPVFIRVLRQRRTMHNNKQEKTPLKKDEISLDAIYGPGKDVSDAQRLGKDLVLYWPGGLEKNAKVDGNSETYIPLTRARWAMINGEKTMQSSASL